MILNLSVFQTERKPWGGGSNQVRKEHTEYLHSFYAALSLIAVELSQKKNASNDCQTATDSKNDAVCKVGT